MEELVELVVKKTGIPEKTAETAVKTVIGFLKDKLPAPLAGQIDAALKNEGMLDQADDVLKGLGGLLGKK
ncbi:MAG: DUF2267 domain-containing protein [Anaerolineae bacterium]|nr:DUF2267 domain-containing protein [Anaerolineae bacterium]